MGRFDLLSDCYLVDMQAGYHFISNILVAVMEGGEKKHNSYRYCIGWRGDTVHFSTEYPRSLGRASEHNEQI